MRTGASGQRGIQSLELGVRMFERVHRLGRPVTLNELAKLADMPASKAHRYCVSLIRTGLLRQDGRGLYGVGPFGFALAHREPSLDHAQALARAAMARLVREVGETIFLSAWGEIGPRILHVVDADRPISIRPNTRRDLPLHNSATGRAFAAYLPPVRLDALLDAELSAEKGSKAHTENLRRSVVSQFGTVRRRALARSVGERYPGLNSFAAPIFDSNGQVILALTSFGLAPTFSSSWDGHIPRALHSAAEQLTRQIGGLKPVAT